MRMAALDGDLLILGVARKMGPSLAHRARRAAPQQAHRRRGPLFESRRARANCEAWGIETIAADLLEPGALERLPDAPNVIFMAAPQIRLHRQRGPHLGDEYVPARPGGRAVPRVAHRGVLDGQRVSADAGGCSGGADESTPPDPVGEYAQSALGRERMFEYFSAAIGTPVTLLRLNYAIDLRYGVLLDIGPEGLRPAPGGSGDGPRQRDLAGRRELHLPALVRALPVAAARC